MNYRFVRLASYYSSMFDDFAKKQDLERLSYCEMQKQFFHQGYGLGNAYERELRALGNDAHTLIPGFDPLQRRWCEEHGMPPSNRFATLLEQLVRLQPEVVYVEDVFSLSEAEVDQLRERLPSLRVLYTFLGSAYTPATINRMRQYDFVMTCSAEFADEFQAAGLETYTILHAFDPDVLSRVQLRGTDDPIDISFLGALTAGERFHNGRSEILHHLIENGIDIELFATVSAGTAHLAIPIKVLAGIANLVSRTGYFPAFDELSIVRRVRNWVPRERMAMSSSVLRRLRSPLFGLDMYRALKRSRVTFNCHVANARVASNMRLFEATGVGTCVLTDWRENLPTLFSPDTEVATYRSKEECLEKARWLLANPEAAESIATAGQQRCLREHTYAVRAQELDSLITRHLASQ
jgi:hypothetical protein